MSDLIIVKMIIYRVQSICTVQNMDDDNGEPCHYIFHTGAVPRAGKGGCVHGFR